MSGVFVAYRSRDAGAWKNLLSDWLVSAYGNDRVFLDKDTLVAGPWQQQIESALGQCSVVLVVIGQRWLSAADDAGERCLWKPEDVHRREIEMALAGTATVIPVLVDGAAMPRKEDLPPSIAALAGLQARPLSEVHRHRESDLRELMSDIAKADRSLVARALTKPTIGPWLFHLIVAVLRLLLLTVVASVVLLVTARVAFGWQFRRDDVSAVTLIVFVALLAISGVRSRVRQRAPYAKH